jgi:hypothetical protein
MADTAGREWELAGAGTEDVAARNAYGGAEQDASGFMSCV